MLNILTAGFFNIEAYVLNTFIMATCSPILIERLAIDKSDPTVIELHTNQFSNTVRKFVQDIVGLHSSIRCIGDPQSNLLSSSLSVAQD